MCERDEDAFGVYGEGATPTYAELVAERNQLQIDASGRRTVTQGQIDAAAKAIAREDDSVDFDEWPSQFRDMARAAAKVFGLTVEEEEQ